MRCRRLLLPLFIGLSLVCTQPARANVQFGSLCDLLIDKSDEEIPEHLLSAYFSVLESSAELGDLQALLSDPWNFPERSNSARSSVQDALQILEQLSHSLAEERSTALEARIRNSLKTLIKDRLGAEEEARRAIGQVARLRAPLERVREVRGTGTFLNGSALTPNVHSLYSPMMSLSPDRTQVAWRRAEGREVTLSDSVTGRVLATLRVPGEQLTSLDWSWDGKRLFGGTASGTIVEFDPVSFTELARDKTFDGVSWISQIATLPNGDVAFNVWVPQFEIAARPTPKKASGANSVFIWHANRRTGKRTIKQLPVNSALKDVQPDTGFAVLRLSTRFEGGNLSRLRAAFKPQNLSKAGTLSLVSPQARYLIHRPAPLSENAPLVVEAVNGQKKQIDEILRIEAHHPMWYALSLGQDRLAAIFPDQRLLRVWSLSLSQAQLIQEVPLKHDLRPEQSSVAVSPDGKYLALGDILGALEIWDTGTGELVTRKLTGLGHLGFIDWSADGQHLFLQSRVNEKASYFSVWSIELGE